MARPTANALRVFFAGLILSGLGSAVYHWAPDAGALVIDRLGMAVAFAGVLALAVAEPALPVLWSLRQHRLGDNPPAHPAAMG